MWAQEGTGEMDKWTVNTDCNSKKFGSQKNFFMGTNATCLIMLNCSGERNLINLKLTSKISEMGWMHSWRDSSWAGILVPQQQERRQST